MPPPDLTIKIDFLHEIGRVQDKLFVILNINNLLSANELSQLKQLASYNGGYVNK